MRRRTGSQLLLKDAPDFMDVPTAARVLGLGRGTVHAMVMSGHLPSEKFGTRRLIRKADLMRLRAPAQPAAAHRPTPRP